MMDEERKESLVQQNLREIALFASRLLKPNVHDFDQHLEDLEKSQWCEYFCCFVLTLDKSSVLSAVPDEFTMLAANLRQSFQMRQKKQSYVFEPMPVIKLNTASSSERSYENDECYSDYIDLKKSIAKQQKLKKDYIIEQNRSEARIAYYMSFDALVEKDKLADEYIGNKSDSPNLAHEKMFNARIDYFRWVGDALLLSGHTGLALHWVYTFFNYHMKEQQLEQWIEQFANISRAVMGNISLFKKNEVKFFWQLERDELIQSRNSLAEEFIKKDTNGRIEAISKWNNYLIAWVSKLFSRYEQRLPLKHAVHYQIILLGSIANQSAGAYPGIKIAALIDKSATIEQVEHLVKLMVWVSLEITRVGDPGIKLKKYYDPVRVHFLWDTPTKLAKKCFDSSMRLYFQGIDVNSYVYALTHAPKKIIGEDNGLFGLFQSELEVSLALETSSTVVLYNSPEYSCSFDYQGLWPFNNKKHFLLSQFPRHIQRYLAFKNAVENKPNKGDHRVDINALLKLLTFIPIDIAHFYDLPATSVKTALRSLYGAGLIANVHSECWKKNWQHVFLMRFEYHLKNKALEDLISLEQLIDTWLVIEPIIATYVYCFPLLPSMYAFRIQAIHQSFDNTSITKIQGWKEPSFDKREIVHGHKVLNLCHTQSCQKVPLKAVYLARLHYQDDLPYANLEVWQDMSMEVYQLARAFYKQGMGVKATRFLANYLNSLRYSLASLERSQAVDKLVIKTLMGDINFDINQAGLFNLLENWLNDASHVFEILINKVQKMSLEEHYAAAERVQSAQQCHSTIFFGDIFAYLINFSDPENDQLVSINYLLPSGGLWPIKTESGNYQLQIQSISPYRRILIDWLNEQSKSNLANLLISLPYKDGTRLSTLIKFKAWQQGLNSILSEQGNHKLSILTEEGVKTGYLPEILEKDIRAKMSHYGRCAVWSFTYNEQTFYIKEYPHLGGLERACNLLIHRLMGEGAPLCTLGKFHYNDEVIPILISQGIPGETLQDFLSHSLSTEQRFSPKRFSQLALLAMILMLEDNKPDNMIVTKREDAGDNILELTLIDNEHFLLPAYIKKNRSYILNTKCVLWCMDEMQQPVHPDVLRDLQYLKADKILKEWLKDLIIDDKRIVNDVDGLFSIDEAEKIALSKGSGFLSIIKNKDRILLGPFFQQDAVYSMFTRIRELQKFLVKSTRKSGLLTHQDILNNLLPEIATFYKSSAVLNDKPLKRFHSLVDQAYLIKDNMLQSSTRAIDVLISQGITLENLNNNYRYTPQFELNRLEDWFEKKCIQDRRILMGHLKVLQEDEFCKKFNEISVSLREYSLQSDIQELLEKTTDKMKHFKYQNIVLRALQNSTMMRKVCLAGFDALDDAMLDTFLRANNSHLKVLVLRDCIRVTTLSIKKWFVPKLMFTSLTKLDLRGCRESVFSSLDNCLLPSKLRVITSGLCWKWGNVPDQLKPGEFDEILALIRYNTKLDWLGLNGRDISDSNVISLAKNLKTNTTLKTIALENNKIGDSGAVALANALAFGDSEVTSLYLGYNEISYTGVSALATMLSVNAKVTEFNLEANRIGDLGVELLAGAVGEKTANVKTLRLEKNNFSLLGAKALSNMLRHNITLTSLYLGQNLISDEGFSELCDALVQSNASLAVLDLSNNNIGNTSLSNLRYLLKNNTTLTTLNLENNSFNRLTLKNLEEIFTHNKTLISLNLEGNNIKNECVEKLKNMLARNSKSLDVYLHAAKNGNLPKIIEILEEKQVSPYGQSEFGNTALHLAKNSKQAAVANYLSFRYPNLNSMTNEYGQLPGSTQVKLNVNDLISRSVVCSDSASFTGDLPKWFKLWEQPKLKQGNPSINSKPVNFDTKAKFTMEVSRYGLFSREFAGRNNGFFDSVFAQLSSDLKIQYPTAFAIKEAVIKHIYSHQDTYRDSIDYCISLDEFERKLIEDQVLVGEIIMQATSRLLACHLVILANDDGDIIKKIFRQQKKSQLILLGCYIEQRYHALLADSKSHAMHNVENLLDEVTPDDFYSLQLS